MERALLYRYAGSDNRHETQQNRVSKWPDVALLNHGVFAWCCCDLTTSPHDAACRICFSVVRDLRQLISELRVTAARRPLSSPIPQVVANRGMRLASSTFDRQANNDESFEASQDLKLHPVLSQ